MGKLKELNSNELEELMSNFSPLDDNPAVQAFYAFSSLAHYLDNGIDIGINKYVSFEKENFLWDSKNRIGRVLLKRLKKIGANNENQH